MEKESQDDETLEVTLLAPTDFTHETSLLEAKQADVQLANGVVNCVHMGWSKVRSLGMLVKMVDATFKAIEHRRHVLGLPYGYAAENSQKPTVDMEINKSKFFSSIK